MTRAEAWVTPGEDGWVGERQQQMYRLCSPRPLVIHSVSASFSRLLLRYNTWAEHAGKHRKAVTFLRFPGNLFLYLEQLKCLAHNKFARCQVRIIAVVVKLNHINCVRHVYSSGFFYAKWSAWWDLDSSWEIWVALGSQVCFLSCRYWGAGELFCPS